MLPRRSPRAQPPRPLPAEALASTAPTWRQLALLIAPLALPMAAAAHAGADAGVHHGLDEGLLHPFTGLDHLAALLASGLWCALSGRRRWLVPLAFTSFMSVGALLAAAGLAIPAVEPMIGVSLLVIGLMVAARSPMEPRVAAAIMGGFALFHGAAHGHELGAGAALLGMVAGSLALQAAGIALGLALRRHSPWWSRAAGGLTGTLGLALLGLAA